MASIYKDFEVAASAEFAWQAIRDVGAVHERLARGFVVATTLDGDVRNVTFANGIEVRERIIAIDDAHRRLVYSAVNGRATHHNAYFQVFADSPQTARVLWVTDLLPQEMQPPIEQMVEHGVQAIQRTLGEAFRAVDVSSVDR